MSLTRRSGGAALVALPGLLGAGLAFASGGWFPSTLGAALLVLGGVLAGRIALAEQPFGGLSRPVAVAAAALALYAAWALASSAWSDAPGRALVEASRTLVYLAAILAVGSLPSGDGRLRWAVRLVVVALTAVAATALGSWTVPGLLGLEVAADGERLRHPLTYWNALGLLAGVGLVLAFGLASDLREHAAGRALAAAATPVLAVTLLATLSRGAIAASALAVAVFVVVARPRGLPGALLAVAGPAAVGMVSAYRVLGLDSETGAGPAAAARGERLALLLAGLTAAAALLRLALIPLDRAMAAWRPPRAALRAVAAAVVAAVALAAVAGEAPSRAREHVDTFLASSAVAEDGDPRARLSSASSNRRTEHWNVALDAFREHPLAGTGAGTYELVWARERRVPFNVLDAHSLYLETLGELGVVGLALLATALLALLAGVLLRLRGDDRVLVAAVFAAALGWALHAGIDWDWELPATTLPPLALAAFAAARRSAPTAAWRPGAGSRAGLVAAVAAVIAAPALMGLADARLRAAGEDFRAGRCAEADDKARQAVRLSSARPEPFELIAWCRLQTGRPVAAAGAMRDALARDPHQWRLHYGLAVMHGAAGEDPLPEARMATRLNPADPLAAALARAAETRRPARWRRVALAARTPWARGSPD